MSMLIHFQESIAIPHVMRDSKVHQTPVHPDSDVSVENHRASPEFNPLHIGFTNDTTARTNGVTQRAAVDQPCQATSCMQESDT